MAFGGMEDRMLRGLDTKFEEKPVIKAAHKKAEELFLRDAPHLESFHDLYGLDVIKNDHAKVQRLKGKFETDARNKIPADILEAIIYEQTELSDWFGPNAQTLKTSEFDDIINGVDLTVEFNEPKRSASHLALAVDATFGTGTIGKKFERIKREIDEDKLATIKYFESSNSNFIGKLSLVPRVVIGTEKETVLRLAGMWVNGEKNELAGHPIQQLILRQVHAQLNAFSNYAKKERKDPIAHSLDTTRELMESIMREKDLIPLGELAQDRVHGEIFSHLAMFK